MPRYEFQCPECAKVFERTRRMSQAGNPSVCPDCGEESPQIISRIAPDHDRMDRLGDARLLDD